mgnify:CR=1 FL=1
MRIFYLIIFLLFLNNHLYSNDDEISVWFDKETKIFHELHQKGNVVVDVNSFEKFIKRNFAVKSIAYGLIPQKILGTTDEITLKRYFQSFEKHLIDTIYLLASNSINSEINLIDIDLKDDVFQLTSEIKYNGNSSRAYWKVVNINSSYKIIDIIVENTSYFVTKKSEFAKILRKNGGDLNKLIKELDKN